MYTIAHIENDYTGKFGVPRQAGLVDEVISRIVFEPKFRNADALRGLEEFSHLWIIWVFSEAVRHTTDIAQPKDLPDGACDWRPTVRPPRLGGNTRMGVFATRSPFRPNPIGLSCVEIERLEMEGDDGPTIYVRGADLMNGTPILDIKPYIPYADCRTDARGGFTEHTEKRTLEAVITPELEAELGSKLTAELKAVLEQDPRPAYQDDPGRVYRFSFGEYEIAFRAENGKALDICVIREHN